MLKNNYSFELSAYQAQWLVGLLVILALLLRLEAANDYWQWFDNSFPLVWQYSKIVLSQDANSYITQALMSQAAGGAIWTDAPFYRPPLASFYFQLVFLLSNIDRLTVSLCQSIVSIIGYLFICASIWRLVNPLIALLTLMIFAIHPILIFYDISFEDNNLTFLFIAAAFFCLSSFINYKEKIYLLAAGILFSLAIVTRANTLLIMLICGLWLLVITLKNDHIDTIDDKSTLQHSTKKHIYHLTLFYLLPFSIGSGLILLANYHLHGSSFAAISLFGTWKSFDLLQVSILAALFLAYSCFFLADFNKNRNPFSLLFASLLSLISCIFFIQSLFISLTLYLFFVFRKPEITTKKIRFTWLEIIHNQLFFLIPVVLMLTLTYAHNHQHNSNSLIISSFGQNIYWGNTSNENHKIYLQGFEFEKWLTKTSPHNSLYENLKITYATNNIDYAMQQAALAEMRLNTADTAWRFLNKFIKSFASYEIPRNQNYEMLSQSSLLFHHYYPPFIIFFLFSFGGLIFYTRYLSSQQYSLFLLFIIPTITLIIIETIFFNASRYRILGLPFLIPLALISLHNFMIAKQNNKLSVAAFTLIITTLLCVLAGHIISEKEKNKYRSVSYYKYARMHLAQNNPSSNQQSNHGEMNIYDEKEFVRLLQQSVALSPDNISAFYLLTMYEITHLNNVDEINNRVIAFANSCHKTDKVCQIVTTNLLTINKNREAFKAGRINYQGGE